MDRPAPQRSWAAVAALVVGLPAALAVLLLAFAWPASQIEPRGLPLAVAGPPQAVDQVVAALGAQADGRAFDVHGMADREAAVAAIEEREVYGAIVVSPAGPEVLVASAAGPAVSQLLSQAGSALAASAGAPPTVTDVVPLPPGDPRGVVFGAGALPLVIGGLAVGMALALRLGDGRQRLVAGAGVSVVAGATLAAVQQYWFEALAGSYLANAGVYALAIAAMAAAVVGLHHVLGLPGAAAAALVILLLGNPLSGITTAPELLPDGWSTLGRLLPPGAAGSALRSVAFFDGAGAAGSLLVLAVWLVAGLALAALPLHRAASRPASRSAPAPAV